MLDGREKEEMILCLISSGLSSILFFKRVVLGFFFVIEFTSQSRQLIDL